jgi:hypothetical protein
VKVALRLHEHRFDLLGASEIGQRLMHDIELQNAASELEASAHVSTGVSEYGDRGTHPTGDVVKSRNEFSMRAAVVNEEVDIARQAMAKDRSGEGDPAAEVARYTTLTFANELERRV